jgi:hypothetical protein
MEMRDGVGRMATPTARRPVSFDELLVRSPGAVETLRLIVRDPAGARVTDLEKKVGDPALVVRTLHRLQSAGLINIQAERVSHDLVVFVPAFSLHRIQGLLEKLS